MLTISFKSGTQVAKALARKGSRVVEVLMTRANALSIQLASYIVASKLSGQVLNRRTGVLAGSVRAIPAELKGKTITFGVSSSGGAAFYGAVHERGGTHPYEIVATNARALRFLWLGRERFYRSDTHPAAKARPFMSTSLAENEEMIEADLQAALNEAMNE